MPATFTYSVTFNAKKGQFIAKVKKDKGVWETKFIPKHVQKAPEANQWLKDWFESKEAAPVVKKNAKRGKGLVYCVQLQNADGYVKIGFTNNLGIRLSHLQTGCPYDFKVLWTQEGTHKTELAFKKLFAAHRVKNEWFFPAALELVVEPTNNFVEEPANKSSNLA